jgi:16S rRNA (cytidine1402-2'-O)-methyltransferase
LGRLILIPNFIDDSDKPELFLSELALPLIQNIKVFIVENERTARRSLRKMGYTANFDEVEMFLLDKHNKDFKHYLDKIDEEDIGLLSEAGLPCIADPGSVIVKMAHEKNIKIVPLIGPSSIFLALMASGMNGQNFSFNGYLPIEKREREKQILFFETLSRKNGQTQIFIETPYRNESLFESFLSVCNPNSRLCIAKNLSQADEFIKTLPIYEWKKQKIDLKKQNTVFILGGQ